MPIPASTSLPVPLPFPPPLVVRANAGGLPRIDSANHLLTDTGLVVPQQIVPGVLHVGTKAVLASGSKLGKTWLLLDLAASIATGTRFLKWNTSAGNVLFTNLEIHRAFMKERLGIIKAAKQLPHLDNLDVLNLRGQGADFETLAEEIIDHIQDSKYDLIILDPIYKLMVGRSENTAAGVGVLCHQIELLAERIGAAVMYAHHFTKGNAAKKKSIDRLSGSGVFARDADTIITMTEHQEEGCYVVEMTLRNLPPQPPFVVEWDFPLMVERPDLDPADLKQDEADEHDDLEPLLDLLGEKPLTTGEWETAAKAQGYSRATFFRMKQKLEDGKRVDFDRKAKTWSRAGDAVQLHAGAAETSETTETPETAETSKPHGAVTQS